MIGYDELQRQYRKLKIIFMSLKYHYIPVSTSIFLFLFLFFFEFSRLDENSLTGGLPLGRSLLVFVVECIWNEDGGGALIQTLRNRS